MSRASAQRAQRSDGASEPKDERDPFDQAFQHLVGEVFRLNGTLLAVADRLVRDLDITPARWQAIAVIRQGPATVSEISRRLGIRRQSLQPTVNRMKDQGIVRLVKNPGHRRAPLVELTTFGEEIWSELLTRQTALAKMFTESLPLDAEALEALTGDLRSLRQNAEGQ